MKFLLTTLSCLAFASGFAETLQHVEYHLPKAAETWIIGNQLKSEDDTTIIYVPSGVQREETDEFFGVNANNKASDIKDPSALKLYLTNFFPNMHIDLQILEKDNSSITYEWSAQEDNIKKFYSIGRAFSSPEGTVILAYQTRNLSQIAEKRPLWLQALKEAKQIL